MGNRRRRQLHFVRNVRYPHAVGIAFQHKEQEALADLVPEYRQHFLTGGEFSFQRKNICLTHWEASIYKRN